MLKKLTKKDIDILEQRGLWKVSSYLDKTVKRLIRKKLPLEIRYIKQAHKIIFDTANQSAMAGKYRRDNPELKRIDGTILKLDHWRQIPNSMAQLDFELREEGKIIQHGKTGQGVFYTLK